MAKKQDKKIIVTASVSGNAHTKEMSPAVPYGVVEISDAAVEAFRAGASMVHIHAREENGDPSANIETFGKILSRTKERSPKGAVIGITTGSAGDAGFAERLAPVPALKPEIASFNSGSINFSSPGDPSSYDEVFGNSLKDMITCAETMRDAGTLPEFEIFDFGMLNNVLFLRKNGYLDRPEYFQFVPGALGCIPMNQDNVAFFVQSMRRMFGEEAQFSMVAPGRRIYRYEILSALWGGNVRVGIEDSLYYNIQGDLATSNAQMVSKVVSILKQLDFEIATSEETREMLQLKGADKVNF
ncbi:MAG: 3-keto-5-aminohexanoate cleavage protein [Clostridiales bacterium]|nr:3-keto-5-aminohexanoate cleavage protein [Clostridiales bacterium]